jgi:hypothetical protein
MLTLCNTMHCKTLESAEPSWHLCQGSVLTPLQHIALQERWNSAEQHWHLCQRIRMPDSSATQCLTRALEPGAEQTLASVSEGSECLSSSAARALQERWNQHRNKKAALCPEDQEC